MQVRTNACLQSQGLAAVCQEMAGTVLAVVHQEMATTVCADVYQEMAGTVGPPLPGTDLRFEAVPEMTYDSPSKSISMLDCMHTL